MKICFLADPTHPNTDRWARYLATDLGQDVWVLATKPDTPPSSSPYKVVPVPVGSKAGYLWLGFRVRKHLKAIKPDILIGYRIQSNGLAAAVSGFRPLVLAAQTETIVWPPGNRFLRACARYAIRRADLLQAWGPHMGDRMIELGASREQVLVLPRGVTTSSYQPPAQPAAGLNLITTRALRAVYNHDLLIRAFATVHSKHPDSKLLFAGDGDERKSLAGLAESLGLESAVSFLGHLNQQDLARHLRESSCYISMVATEGVSSSLLEAMSCGTVPIVPDLPGNTAWVRDGENGRILPLDAIQYPDQVAEIILAAFNDGPLRQRALAQNPIMVREGADWDTNMRKMLQAYSGLSGES